MMISLKRASHSGFRLLLLSSLLSTGVFAANPEENYACQVQTTGGRYGLVLLQTHNKKEAMELAITIPALTLDGSEHLENQVVECISRPGGSFRDSGFQKFYESVPL
ncbi:MAG: hypothetical protein V7709_06010 [Halioglobus sp.]